MVLRHHSIRAAAALAALFSYGPLAAAPVPATGAAVDPSPNRGGYAYAAGYSRDGKWLALTQPKAADGTGKHKILLFETRTWKQLGQLTGPTDACSGVVFSADGTRLFAACTDGLVYSWDTKSGTLGQKLDAGAGRCHSIALAPDGKTLVTGHLDAKKEPARSSIHAWDAATGKALRAFSPDVRVLANTLTFTPDGLRVAAAAVDPRAGKAFTGVVEWDLATGNEQKRYEGRAGQAGGHAVAHAIRYTRDGKWLIVGGGETVSDPATPNASNLYGFVCLFDRTTGRPGKTLVSGRHDHVRLLLLSPDEDRLYVPTRSTPRKVEEQGRVVERTFDELQCWDTKNWELKWVNESELTTYWALIASPDGRRIGTSTGIGFYFYDSRTGDPKGGLIYAKRE